MQDLIDRWTFKEVRPEHSMREQVCEEGGRERERKLPIQGEMML